MNVKLYKVLLMINLHVKLIITQILTIKTCNNNKIHILLYILE